MYCTELRTVFKIENDNVTKAEIWPHEKNHEFCIIPSLVCVCTLLTFAGGDAVFKMTAPYHRTVASYDFFNDYRGYFIVSFEFRRPEYPEGENWPKSRHWSNVRASSKVSVQQSLLRGINRCVSRSVTGISRMFINRNRPAPFSATCAMMSIG